jgi:hypothetical protein
MIYLDKNITDVSHLTCLKIVRADRKSDVDQNCKIACQGKQLSRQAVRLPAKI